MFCVQLAYRIFLVYGCQLLGKLFVKWVCIYIYILSCHRQQVFKRTVCSAGLMLYICLVCFASMFCYYYPQRFNASSNSFNVKWKCTTLTYLLECTLLNVSFYETREAGIMESAWHVLIIKIYILNLFLRTFSLFN